MRFPAFARSNLAARVSDDSWRSVGLTANTLMPCRVNVRYARTP